MRLVASILFNKATTFLGRFMCYWVGARLGSGGRFFGLPWIRVEGRNASVTIGMRFRACSERGYNAIGGGTPTLPSHRVFEKTAR